MVVVYSLLGLVLLYLLGAGPTLLLCPPRLRPYALLLMPVVGAAAILPLGWFIHAHDLGTVQATIWPIAALAGVLAVVGIRCGWSRPDTAIGYAFVAAAVGFITVYLPGLVRSDLSFFTVGADDGIFYAWGSLYLQRFSEPTGLFGQFDIGWFVATRFGIYYVTAVVASILHIGPWQAINLVGSLGFVAGLLVLYTTAREAFGFGAWTALVLALLYGLNPMMAKCTQTGFFPQMWGSAFSIGFLLAAWLGSQDPHWRYGVLATLFLWGVLVTFPHMVPLIVPPLFLLSWRHRKGLIFLAICTLAAFLISTEKALLLVHEFTQQSANDPAWDIPFLLTYKLFGSGFDRDLQPLRDILLSLPLVAFTAMGWQRSDYASRVILTWCVALYLGMAALHPAYFGGYKSFKVFSFMFPWFLLAWLAPWGGQAGGPAPMPRWGRGLLGALLLFELAHVGCFLNSTQYMAPTEPDLAGVQPKLSINLLGSNNWDVMWQAYFLADHTLYFRVGTYMAASPQLRGEWNLVDALEQADDKALKLQGFGKRSERLINNRYRLARFDTPVATLQRGWRDEAARPDVGPLLTIACPRPWEVIIEAVSRLPDGREVSDTRRVPLPSGTTLMQFDNPLASVVIKPAEVKESVP